MWTIPRWTRGTKGVVILGCELKSFQANRPQSQLEKIWRTDYALVFWWTYHRSNIEKTHDENEKGTFFSD